MALTVGELNALLTIDDRAVQPALRRAENALRQAGRTMGGDAERSGEDAGERLGQGLVRGADGQWRNLRGELADASTAAVAEAEAIMRRGGRRIASAAGDAGDQAGQQLGDGIADGAEQGVEQAGGRLERLKMLAAGAGAAAGAVLISGMQEALSQGQLVGKLQAQLGATPAEAERYGKIAGKLYTSAVTDTFEEGTQAIRHAMQSGLIPPGATNAQIESISRKVSDLSKTFEVELGDATVAVGQMIRTGMVRDANEGLDLIGRAFQINDKRADDMLETLNEYPTQFRDLGLTGSQALGIMQQGFDGASKDSDKVADALKELNIRVQSLDAEDGLTKLGIDAKAAADAFGKGGPEAAAMLDLITDRLRAVKDPTERYALAQEILGTQSEDLSKALLAIDPSQANQRLGKFKGTVDEAGNALRDNAGTKLKQFQRGMQQNLVEFLGGKVVPALSKAFGWMQEHQGEIKAGATLITGIVVPALVLLGGKALWAGIQMARAWVMALGPVGWIGLAIGALVVLVIAYWDEIKAGTLAAWNWVVDKLKWAKDGVLAAVSYLGTIPGKISAWFGQAKDWAVEKMTALVGWLRGLPGRIGAALGGLLGVVRQRATSAFQSMRDAAVQRALALVTWVAGLPGRISRGIGSLSSLLVQKGRNVVQGLWNGIQGMGGWIKDKLMSWARNMIPKPIAKALGIASPSKVTKAQGQWIAKGLIDGLTGSEKQVRSAADKLSGIVKDALTGKREKAALKGIKANTKWLAHQAKVAAKVATQLKNAEKKLADLQKARTDLVNSVRNSIVGDADITKQDTGGWAPTAASILANLRQDTLAAQQFAKNIAALQKKGVRRDLISQIAQAGVQGGAATAAALANASSKEIKAINDQQALLNGAAAQTGRTAGDAMYKAGIQAAQGLVKGLTSHQKYLERTMLALAKSMSKGIRKALGIKSPSRVMAVVGAYTAQGLVKGLEGERAAVNRTMSSLVETPAPGGAAVGAGGGYGRRGKPVQVQLVVSGSRREDQVLTEMIRRRVRIGGGGDVQAYFGQSKSARSAQSVRQ